MCRVVAYVSSSRPIPLESVINARERSGRKKTFFSISREERIHGFGVAWAAVGRQFGALVTLDPPLSDVNVRRVCGSISSRVVLAHLRCCACETCPATTYCGAHLLNSQPLVYRGNRGDVVLAHVGILDHHLALESAPEDPLTTRTRSIDLVDSHNSDTAFLFKLVLSFYFEDEMPRLERAVARAIFELSSSPLHEKACSLNITAADADCVVTCRYRSGGDDRQPPTLYWTREEGAVTFASSPVSLATGESSDDWKLLAPGKLIVVAASSGQPTGYSLTQDGPYLVRDEELTSRLSSSGAHDRAAVLPQPKKNGASSKQRHNKASSTSLSETLARSADGALRSVVKEAFKKYSKDDNGSRLGNVAAKARKEILGNLRRELSHATSLEEGNRRIESAKIELEEECRRATLPKEYRLDLCGDDADGDVARSIMSESRCTRLEALAVVQARLYDARFQEAAVGEATSADKAGVEEVKDVMTSEAHAFRSGVRLVRKNVVNVVDFGCGDGRFFAEFERTALTELDPGSELRVVAYEVSPGALEACRRRCLRDLGFSLCSKESQTYSKRLVDDRRIVIVFVLGHATTSAEEFEALLPKAKYDLVLSGWGSTSAIPDLTEVDDANQRPHGKRRQDEFIAAFARLAPVLVQIVSSANNFVGPNSHYSELRKRRQERNTDSLLRLATRPGQFYYTVAGHDYFYSAVDPAQERRRLSKAGYDTVNVRACNVASFRDILASPKLAKLERAVLAFVDANRRHDLESFLKKAVALATKNKKMHRSSPLFDPNRTLVDQLARYIISVSFKREK